MATHCQTEGVPLRRRRRQVEKQTTDGQSNILTTIVFRSHAESTSTVPFLYYPKNYGLPMPAPGEPFTEAIIELFIPSHDSGDGCGEGYRNNSFCGSSCSQGQSIAPSVGGVGGTSNAGTLFSTGSQLPLRFDGGAARSGVFPSSDPIAIATGRGTTHTDAQSLGWDSATATPCVSHESWVCRAYCFGEKDAPHSNGAISVLYSLANKSKFINNIANGKAVARVIPSYDEVCERFGLSHVELSFERQQISRADMFLIAEALRDNIVYEGEEINLLGFCLKVNEMLRKRENNPAPHGNSGGGVPQAPPAPRTGLLSNGFEHNGAAQHHRQEGKVEEQSKGYRSVRCGLVTKGTVVNFLSLSAVHYIILEISAEMWNLTSDGCIQLDWAVKNFLGEYLTQQLSKHKASPHLRIVMAGRLHPKYAIRGCVDVVHVMHVPDDCRSPMITEDINLQCEEFLRRVLGEVKEELRAGGVTSVVYCNSAVAGSCTSSSSSKTIENLTARDLFVPSKNSCTVETIGVLLDETKELRSNKNTGLMISVVSAGKGIFQVTNDLVQAICIRLLKVGMEKVNIICMGRPPLHSAPLLECVNDDENPSFSHFGAEQPCHRLYIEAEWARCYFYQLPSDFTGGNVPSSELFTREEWFQKHWKQIDMHRCAGEVAPLSPGLAIPPMQPRGVLLLPVIQPRTSGPSVAKSEAPSESEDSQKVKSSAPLSGTPTGLGEDVPRTTQAQRNSREASADPCQTKDVSADALSEGRELREAAFRSLMELSPALPGGDVWGSLGYPQIGSRKQLAHQPFVCARWYRLVNVCLEGKGQGNWDTVCEFILKGIGDCCQVSRIGRVGTPIDAPSIVPCGRNIVDFDVQSGNMVLRLDLNPVTHSGRAWNPCIINDANTWTWFMDSFSDKVDHFTCEERKNIDPKFCAANIFNRDLSVIVADGQTLLLPTRKNNVAFIADERVVLKYRDDFFLPFTTSFPHVDTMPLPSSAGSISSCEARGHNAHDQRSGAVTAPVAHVQLKNGVMFAMKPINPYCTSVRTDEASIAAHGASTETILRRRWKFAHPELSSSYSNDAGAAAAQRSHWSALCHCRILPLFGAKPAYPRDSFFDKPIHQYSIPMRDTMQSLEYVLQRLQHRHQIVLSLPSVAEIQWPREDVIPHARVVTSIGYQIHELKIDETGQSIHITRLLHRSVYTSLPKMQKVEHKFLLLNYLNMSFSARRVNLEMQISEEAAFQWDALDSYIHDRGRSDTFIPRSLTLTFPENEMCLAIIPESLDNACVSYQDFLGFMEKSLNSSLRVRTPVTWAENVEELSTGIPVGDSSNEEPTVNCVVLVDEKQLSLGHCRAMDRRTGRTRCLEEPPPNRQISINVSLPREYNRRCHYLLRVSWMVCTQPVLLNWVSAVSANAPPYHLRCVLLPTYECSAKQDEMIPCYTVLAQNEEEGPHFRARLLDTLTSSTYRYLPDNPMMGGKCRLLHMSGLCYVISSPKSNVVACWCENPMMGTGQMSHKMLLEEFLVAVQTARNRP